MLFGLGLGDFMTTFFTLKRLHSFGQSNMFCYSRNFGQRLLFLSDNLPLTLSASKGRGKSSFLTKPLRQLCAFALATGSKLHVRWIPSEWNVADRPSRALTQRGARGFDSWFNEAGQRGRGHDIPNGSRIPEGQSSRKKIEKTSGGSRKFSSASKHQLLGSPKCESSNNQGLFPKVQRISELDEPASACSSSSIWPISLYISLGRLGL